jgi:hypothetical protein
VAQNPEQLVVPAPQLAVMQAPAEHICPAAQALPQRPQWKESVAVETQNPEQLVVPAGHVPASPVTEPHRPPVQACPAAQRTPHAPQFS